MSTKAIRLIISLIATYSDLLGKQNDVIKGAVIDAMLSAHDGHSLHWCETPEEQKEMQDLCIQQIDRRLLAMRKEIELHIRAYSTAKAQQVLRNKYEEMVIDVFMKASEEK
jgi:hypothetical protein